MEIGKSKYSKERIIGLIKQVKVGMLPKDLCRTRV
jgi:hypothetical protein